MHFDTEGEIWVMHRGILRGYPDTLLDGSYNVGDILWAKGESGLITTVRPTYQNALHVKVGKITAESGGDLDIEIDVQVLPRADAIPNNVGRRWSWMMGD
jgi:hypothetical protein